MSWAPLIWFPSHETPTQLETQNKQSVMETGREREKAIFHPLVGSTNGSNGQSWAWPKPGDWNSTQIFHVAWRDSSPWATEHGFPKHILRELDQEQSRHRWWNLNWHLIRSARFADGAIAGWLCQNIQLSMNFSMSHFRNGIAVYLLLNYAYVKCFRFV